MATRHTCLRSMTRVIWACSAELIAEKSMLKKRVGVRRAGQESRKMADGVEVGEQRRMTARSSSRRGVCRGPRGEQSGTRRATRAQAPSSVHAVPCCAVHFLNLTALWQTPRHERWPTASMRVHRARPSGKRGMVTPISDRQSSERALGLTRSPSPQPGRLLHFPPVFLFPESTWS